jgi:hypothetical protein
VEWDELPEAHQAMWEAGTPDRPVVGSAVPEMGLLQPRDTCLSMGGGGGLQIIRATGRMCRWVF